MSHIEGTTRATHSRRAVGLSALLAPSLVALAAGCARQVAEPTHLAPDLPTLTVHVAVIEASGQGQALVPGAVHARESATLAARAAAAVVALPFREGESVARGALVARLDDAALRSAVAAADAARGAADADAQRTQALTAARAATARELEVATARAAGARAQAQAAREALSYAELRAPFAGTLAARHVEVGDVVQPGQPLIELEGAGGFELRVALPSALASGLAVGQHLTCRIDGLATPMVATIRSLSASADPATQRLEVRADLGAAPGLRSGLFARLAVPDPSAEPGLRVPSSALFARGGLTGLFTVADGKAHLRWVAVGAEDAGWTEIRSGVSKGERVVLDPGELQDEQPVVEASGPGAPAAHSQAAVRR